MKPNLHERAEIFHRLFVHLESQVGPENTRKTAGRILKRDMINQLNDVCPALTRPPGRREALRGAFDRKLKRWQAGGRTVRSLMDNRPTRSGNFNSTKAFRLLAALQPTLRHEPAC